MSESQTFKQFLREFDRSDLQLQQDHTDQRQNKADFNKDADEFKSKMDAQRKQKAGTESQQGEPQNGDVLQSPSGKQFVVKGRTNKGFRVQELGGNGKQGVLPHGKKYVQAGKTPLGKAIYKLS